MAKAKTGFFSEIIQPALSLCLIAVIVVGALVYTNSVTAPIIAENMGGASLEAAQDIYPDVSFILDDRSFASEDGVDIVGVYRSEDGSATAVVTAVSGYGGEMNIVVGIGSGGTIDGVRMAEGNKETPGYGSRAGEPEYTDLFIGKKAGETKIDILSGATVTSSAMIKAVGVAMNTYAAL